MIGSGLLGLYQFTAQNAQVVNTFPVNLSSASVSESRVALSIPDDTYLSLWLKVPGRAIETKDIVFTANFISTMGTNTIQVVKEFGFFHTRTSVVGGQLYKIGEHHFSNGFVGNLKIRRESDWNPKYEATLLVKSMDSKNKINLLFFSGIFTLGALLVTFSIKYPN